MSGLRIFRVVVLVFVLFSFGGCTKVGTKVAFVSATQTVNESAGTATIQVTLTEPSALAVRVPYTLGGTASPGGTPSDDYLGSEGTLVIPIGSKTGALTFPLVTHSSPVPDRTIVVSLGTPENAELGSVSVHTLTLSQTGGGGGGGPPTPPMLNWPINSAFYEDPANIGSIYNRPVSVQVAGGTWANTAFIANTHYTLSGSPPAGLSLSFNRVSNTQLDITLTGNAGSHTGFDSGFFDITFTSAAFTDGVAPIDGSETKTNYVILSDSKSILYAVPATTLPLGNRTNTDATCLGGAPAVALAKTHNRAVISYGPGFEIADMVSAFTIPPNMIVSATDDLIVASFIDLVMGDFINNLATANVMPASTFWWSGAESMSLFPPTPGQRCSDWTSSAGGVDGTVGISDGGGIDWMAQVALQPCNTATNYLLCIGFD